MNVKTFPSFVPSYKRLKENEGGHFSVEFYHHDVSSEPTFYINEVASKVAMEKIESEGIFITIIFGNFLLTFGDRNYHSNLSNDAVVFSSKFDEKTYCVIQFS